MQQLRADTEHVLLVQDRWPIRSPKTQAVSADGRSWYLPVGVARHARRPRRGRTVESVRDLTAEVFADSSTTAQVTGPPATFSDMIAAAEHDLLLISIATAAMVALILLIVYRSMFTALLPLLVIGLSLAVGRGVLSALGEMGMPVSQFTVAFMTAIPLGAGTDYTVFLISRYHEQRRAQVPAEQAIIHATASIGRVILALRSHRRTGLSGHGVRPLSVFAALGPACAIAVLVGFLATVTLLPPVLALAAKRGIGEPKSDRTRRYWNSVAVAVVRRPVPLLIVSLVILLALSAVAATIKISYDDRKGQPATTASNQGYQLLDRHFRKDAVITEFLVVENPTDMRTGKGLADLDEMASRVSQVPGVTTVSGVTRPTGERLDQAQLAWQNGQIRRQDGRRGRRRQRPPRRPHQTHRRRRSTRRRTAQLDTSVRTALALWRESSHKPNPPALRSTSSGPAPTALSDRSCRRSAIQSGPGIRPLADQADHAITMLDPPVGALTLRPGVPPHPNAPKSATRYTS